MLKEIKMSFESSIIFNNDSVSFTTHSDGAVSLKVPVVKGLLDPYIQANIKDSSGMLALMYLLDYLNTHVDFQSHTFTLDLSYFPNARQDRVTGNEEVITPNTTKMFANFLNSCKRLVKVYSSDVHSNVPLVLMDKLVEQTHKECYMLTVPLEITDGIDYFISPDLGAYKKVKSIADNYDLPYLVAQKERHPVTREIELSLTTNVDLTGKTVMICDDIVDYGNSVRELVKTLREKYKVGKVFVYATHGILPMNYRLEIPSRFSFVTEGVEKLYTCYLWKDEQNTEIPENVEFFDQF